YTGPVAEDCGVIIDAVIDSYTKFLDDRYRDVSRDTVTWVKEAKKTLETDKKDKQKELHKLRQDHPELTRTKEGITGAQERILTIQQKLAAISLRQTELAAKLEALDQAEREKRPREELLAQAYADLGNKSSASSLLD